MKEQEFVRIRDQYAIEVRKQHRENTFKKRRGDVIKGDQMEDQNIELKNKIIIDPEHKDIIEEIMDMKFNPIQVEQLAKALKHAELAERLRGIIGLRILASDHHDEYLAQQMIDLGCVPIFLEIMSDKRFPQMQLQATWILSNIACGSTAQCESIINKNGLDVLFFVIKQGIPYVSQQAMWGLGNIAGDSTPLRDSILNKNGMDVILKAMGQSENITFLKMAAWTATNLMRGTPKPKYKMIKAAIPVLGNLVMAGVLDEKEVSQVLWSISGNTQSQKTRIKQIVDVKGFIPHLFDRYWQGTSEQVLLPLLRVFGNLSIGNELQTEQLLRNNCLQMFTKLLDYPKSRIVKEVCWIISNICVGTKSQLQQILSHNDLMRKLQILFASGQPQVKKQISYIMGNICHSGEPNAVFNFLKEYRYMDNLVAFINSENNDVCLQGGLFALFEVLKLGDKVGSQNIVYFQLEQQPGFFQRLQNLQAHQSTQVYNRVIQIFKGFFATVETSL